MRTAWCVIFIVALLAIAAWPAFAQCSTRTYVVNGRVITCTTCGQVTNCNG